MSASSDWLFIFFKQLPIHILCPFFFFFFLRGEWFLCTSRKSPLCLKYHRNFLPVYLLNCLCCCLPPGNFIFARSCHLHLLLLLLLLFLFYFFESVEMTFSKYSLTKIDFRFKTSNYQCFWMSWKIVCWVLSPLWR